LLSLVVVEEEEDTLVVVVLVDIGQDLYQHHQVLIL
jgi:hypothetical protein